MTEKKSTEILDQILKQLNDIYQLSLQENNVSCALKCLELQLKYVSSKVLGESSPSLQLKEIKDEDLQRWIEELNST